MEASATRLTQSTAPAGEALSLKQQLVAAVAKGDEMAAEEIRLLLKIESPPRARRA
ncbi:MAG: hypothetical protein V2J89_11010 [Halieaceae bacterium]|jgi:hypothetical protein|nr:hypothetical protein [Halieaceae bacterium]